MKVCVLVGSPKGKDSITYQTVRFLKSRFSEDSFRPVFVGQQIRVLEKDPSPALDIVKKADLILFNYPVYTFVVPSQLHRFVELMKESGVDLSGKLAAQICTSKHFYDVTAMAFIRENCGDMGMKYLGALSADMEDLLSPEGQEDALAFWELIRWRAEQGICEDCTLPVPAPQPPYEPRFGDRADSPKGEKGEVVIVANLDPEDADLAAMIDDFRALWPHKSRVVNLREYPFSGGCLGCFNCATDGKCIYKDGFDRFLREEIQTAAATVYAFRITDHSMGSRMKLFDDRQFCNGHRTVTFGKPVGYLVRGDLTAEPSLKMVIEGRADVGGNFLAGVAADPDGVEQLAKTLDYALKTRLTQPQTFLGVGGTKIFRDLIWVMQGMMKADHKFYKAHGIYDFPQKQRGTILKMKLVGALISNPKIKAKMGNKMTEGMLAPYEKVLRDVE